MSRILFLQNDRGSGGGVLLEEVRAQGLKINVLVPYKGLSDDAALPGRVPSSPDGFDGLVVLGGVMGVNDRDRHPFIEQTEVLIRQFAQTDKPVMGVCFGSQLIASAMGGVITRLEAEEWGFLPQTWRAEADDDPLLTGTDAGLPVMQWHQDTFSLPPGAVHLSERPGCPHQAFRIGRTVYGFQFHLELDRPTLEHWVDLRAQETGLAPEALRSEMMPEIARHYGAQERFGRQVMRRWLDLAG